jgi:hypothetical protein
MAGERYRIVTEHNFKPHDKTVVVSEEEAYALFNAEIELYERYDWMITRGSDTFVARRNNSVRIVSIRRLTPMEDV